MRSTTPHCRGNYGIVHYFVEDCISPWRAQRGDIAMAVWVSLRQKALVGWHRDSGFGIVPVGMTSAGQCMMAVLESSCWYGFSGVAP